jgi:hypothetical protein
VRMTYYRPAIKPRLTGHPDWMEPGWPAEIEFEVLDTHGEPFPLLERDMTDMDVRAVEQELIEAMDTEDQQARIDAAELNEY